MAVGYNPRAVTDGLVLALDAGNPKNYNVGISTNWTDKVGGNNGTLVGGTHHNDGPFVGAGYVEFDGSGDYLSIADDASLDMGSSDFTIEGWYFPLGNATVSTAIFSKRANSSTVGGLLVYYGSTGLTPSLVVDIGGSWAINNASSVSFVANQWNHFAVTRNGSAFNLYINGVSGVSASNAGSIPDNSSAFVIGAMGADGSGTISSCYISNFRVVKGTALYTSNFTPPTGPLTAVTNTKLLTCQGNTISPGTDIVVTTSNKGSGSVGSLSAVTSSGNYYFDNRSASPSTASIQLDFKTVQVGVTQIKLSGGSYALGSTFDLYVNGVLVEDDRSVVSGWGEDTITISSTNISSIKIEGSDGYSLGALKFNGTLVSGTISEIVPNGDISLTKEPFAGAGAVEFDGTGDYLSLSSSSDFYFEDHKFTVECWTYTGLDVTSVHTLLAQWGSGSDRNIEFDYRGDASKVWRFYYRTSSTTEFVSSIDPVEPNSWYHLAAVADGSNLKLYVNGVLQETNSIAGNAQNSTANLYIGAYQGTTSYYNGFISNLRVIKGTALYTSNFTPPSRTLTAVPNTVLLTCQGQNIKDASSSAHAITVNGDAKATIVSSAFEFDGTDDYVVTSSNTDFLFGTEEFAMEWWEYFTGGGGYIGHIGVFDSSNATPMIWTVSGSFHGYVSGSGWSSVAMSPLSNQWAHYVVTGVTGNIRFYQNGELKDTTTWNWSATSSASNFSIACGWSQSWQMPGKISAVRVYKGKSFTEDEVTQNYNATKGRYA